MAILARSVLDKAQDGESFSGEVLIKTYTKGTTKKGAGKPFLDGTLCSGKDFGFKVWSGGNGLLERMLMDNCSGKVCTVTVTAQLWQGGLSFIMTDCNTFDGHNASDFLPIKYDKNAYVTALTNFLKTSLSDEGFSLVSDILLNNAEVMERFATEFSAKSHHDNCKSGLLAHTFKVLSTINFYLISYPYLKKFNPRQMKVEKYQSDLFYIGALLHDLGKIREMQMGVYQPNTSTTHRYLGTEMISVYKDKIIVMYDEKWYYDLIAILLQHHHTFEDPAKTVFSLIVHMADMSDSTLTSLCDNIENSSSVDNAGSFIWQDSSRLFL